MRVAIVGAGFGGMAAAYDLRNAGHDVTIFETADSVGGLASGFKEPHWDWSVEKFYHHWFETDTFMLELIRELGWTSKVLFQRPYTVIQYDGKWYPFDSVFRALLFPGLGFGWNKIRFGLVGLYIRATNDWRTLEKVTAADWLQKYAGRTVYEEVWKPLLVGKFGSYHDQVNMAWMWARLKVRSTRLGTFEGGFQRFADMFAQRIREAGGKIRLETPVESIKVGRDGGLIIAADREESFDKVLVTTSPSLLAKACPDLAGSYLKGLLQVKAMGAVVMVLSLKQQLSKEGYYWYNLPKDAGYPMLTLIEHSNFISAEHFGGDHIVYAGDYVETGHEYMSMSEPQLLERFVPAFIRINPAFERNWIRKMWVSKTRYAQPVPLVNHSRNIPPLRTPIEGLYFASMGQVYPWDRGTNFAVEIGRRAARTMLTP